MDWSTNRLVTGGGGAGGGGGGMAEDIQDILVFGYACKLFRDDEKAAWIDSGSHLIPWMGSASKEEGGVLIDRYDCRGALLDLSGGADISGEESQSQLESQRALELRLEEERYKDLREETEFDDNDYQEVEFRKFQSDVAHSSHSYAAIGYTYEKEESEGAEVQDQGGGVGGQDEGGTETQTSAEEEQPYKKPRGLTLPANITLPQHMREHSRILKTAEFIASHGPQMEIILKTKQSGNPAFEFLEHKHKLNQYFKALLTAIRDRSYIPNEPTPPASAPSHSNSNHHDPDHDDETDSDSDEYLHPSLFGTANSTASPLPPMPLMPSSTLPTAYSLLVDKIKAQEPPPPPPAPAPPPVPSQSQNQTNGNYEYEQYQHQLPAPPTRVNESPPPNEQLVIEKMASYVVKNGGAFEELAMNKGDPRFLFLSPSHVYHWYYLNCKERFRAETQSVCASAIFQPYTPSTSTTPTNTTNSSASATPATTEKKKRVAALPVPVPVPLSASGIPIANLASISNRPTTIPPEVQTRIELIKMKKNSLFEKSKEKEVVVNKIQFSSAIGKGMVLVGQGQAGQVGLGDDGQDQGSKEDTGEKKEKENGAIEIDESERLKQLRRQKAALFLQKINATSKANIQAPATPKTKEAESQLQLKNTDLKETEVEVEVRSANVGVTPSPSDTTLTLNSQSESDHISRTRLPPEPKAEAVEVIDLEEEEEEELESGEIKDGDEDMCVVIGLCVGAGGGGGKGRRARGRSRSTSKTRSPAQSISRDSSSSRRRKRHRKSTKKRKKRRVQSHSRSRSRSSRSRSRSRSRSKSSRSRSRSRSRSGSPSGSMSHSPPPRPRPRSRPTRPSSKKKSKKRKR